MSKTTTIDDLLLEGTPLHTASIYKKLAKEAKERNFGLIEEDIIILDTETTGLSFEDDELIEVGAVRLRGRKVVDEFDMFVHPNKPISKEIEKITHISNDDVKDAPGAEEVIQKLHDFVHGAPVVAHNASFDKTFITHVKGGGDVTGNWIDSLALSRIALPCLKTHALQPMSIAFECTHSTHRAIDDVYALAGIWRIILCALTHLPHGFLSAMADMHKDIKWEYRSIFSQLAAEQKSTVFSLQNVRTELLQKIEIEAKDDAADEDMLLTSPTRQEIEAAFTEDGEVGRMYENFEPRSDQLKMAIEVRHALATSTHLAVEATTGVGKSIAYLLPLAAFAKKNHITCGVATKTNALTDQLMAHELPALKSAMDGDLNYTCIKGYDHYPCLLKVKHAMSAALPLEKVYAQGASQNTIQSSMLTAIVTVLAYASQMPEGDIDGMGIRWKLVPKSMLTTTPQECTHSNCPFFKSGCFLRDARKRAAAADIVVTNHALLLCDVAAEGNILPPIRHWVIDEAHTFDDEARRQWALEISSTTLKHTIDTLGNKEAGVIKNMLISCGNEAEGRLASALLVQASNELERTRNLAGTFFNSLDVFLKSGVAEKMSKDSVQKLRQTSGGYDNTVIWLSKSIRSTDIWKDICRCGNDLSHSLDEVIKRLSDVKKQLKDLYKTQPDKSAQTGLEGPFDALVNSRDALRIIISNSDESNIFSLEAFVKGNRRGTFVLGVEKYDIGSELAERWYPEVMSVIFCSATMAIGDSFEHFNRLVGLSNLNSEDYRVLLLGSSYNYDENMAVLVAKDLPDPYSANYLDAMEEALFNIHMAMGGSTLTLFTNRRDMEELYKRLQPKLYKEHLDLIYQSRQANAKNLREQFIADEQLSLFALKSFWEGFDAAGDTLKCVVVPKLPFSRPSDPLSLERDARDQNAWFNYSLPEAVLSLKQAAGRLIRTSTDEGILVLLDCRCTQKRYGQEFIRSLPSRNVRYIEANTLARCIESWREER